VSVVIAPQYTQRFYRWTNWKVVQFQKNGIYQYDNDGIIYTIWFYDGPEAHICTIWLGDVPYTIINSGYSQIQNDSDLDDFIDNYQSNGNKSIAPVTTLGGLDKNGNIDTLSMTLDGGKILNVQDETTNDLLKQLINKIDKMTFYLEQMSDVYVKDEDME
jgi:hypothetical protein